MSTSRGGCIAASAGSDGRTLRTPPAVIVACSVLRAALLSFGVRVWQADSSRLFFAQVMQATPTPVSWAILQRIDFSISPPLKGNTVICWKACLKISAPGMEVHGCWWWCPSISPERSFASRKSGPVIIPSQIQRRCTAWGGTHAGRRPARCKVGRILLVLSAVYRGLEEAGVRVPICVGIDLLLPWRTACRSRRCHLSFIPAQAEMRSTTWIFSHTRCWLVRDVIANVLLAPTGVVIGALLLPPWKLGPCSCIIFLVLVARRSLCTRIVASVVAPAQADRGTATWRCARSRLGPLCRSWLIPGQADG
mmetsp:Transcript_104536/g.181534  ORF Transcript_104536/g.181534 Transcript_104536/m.181534 type:complete len:308 (-) Transcript_104536:125-1048(-)